MMDSNSNSFDMYSPKLEMDSESEREYSRREMKFKVHWNSENTMKLIEAMEKECKELWDTKNPLNKDRNARQARLEFLADLFGTTSEEMSRKIHNLRTQFNNELRKIKRRQVVRSGWEYFDALSFLMRAPSTDPLETVDAVNLEHLVVVPQLAITQQATQDYILCSNDAGTSESQVQDTNRETTETAATITVLAEFQADEEEEFGAAARAHAALALNNGNSNNSSPSRRLHRPLRVAASAPLPLPPSANPLMWPEEPTPRIRPGLNADECQIFGDFVASELRTLRSHESRKRLKRMIQKAILQIGEEEDVNMISG